MARGHTPFGYRIRDGRAEICETEVQQLKEIYSGYLSGLSYKDAARRVGLEIPHCSVKRLLSNRHYLGDDFYPAVIDRDVFDAAEQERERRSKALGREHKARPLSEPVQIPVRFVLRTPKRKILEPFEQAEYSYSLIESEV